MGRDDGGDVAGGGVGGGGVGEGFVGLRPSTRERSLSSVDASSSMPTVAPPRMLTAPTCGEVKKSHQSKMIIIIVVIKV